MSKSLGNTVSPEDMIARYGADTVRLFILFAANPTAGMDWSDAALDANHRVMVQMRGMPAQLMAWSGGASPMDGWLEARFTQRVNEFVKAMDEYDLRRAVELSHYEVIKDINWYAPGRTKPRPRPALAPVVGADGFGVNTSPGRGMVGGPRWHHRSGRRQHHGRPCASFRRPRNGAGWGTVHAGRARASP